MASTEQREAKTVNPPIDRGTGRRRAMVFLAILCSLSSILTSSIGCQRVLPPKNEPVVLMEDRVPLEPDEATVLRDFDKSTSYYPSGATEALSTRTPWAQRAKAKRFESVVMGVPIFAANVVSLPFTYFFKEPFGRYTYHGSITNPTYTAMPAYPAEAPVTGPTEGNAAPVDPGLNGPVPPTDALVPGVNEPVRDPSGEQPLTPTQNPGADGATPADDATATPADGETPAPVTPPTGGTDGAGDAGSGSTGGSGAATP